MARTKVSEYEVVDHGIDNSQYFQGCGVAYSKYTDVVTGIGSDFKEAFDDALESMAQNDVDVESIESAEKPEDYGKDTVPDDAEECYYYVSIRYSLAD